MAGNTPATFVLVHGAWAGAWAWMRVVDLLTAKGHRASALTLSGLGERSHLADLDITLTTHVNDVVNEVEWKDLDRTVLVGHSYGGLVITAAAERIADRLASIVYVDAFIPADNQSFSTFGPDFSLLGKLIPPPPTAPGDYLREADRAWVDRKATPQPRGTFTERVRITGAYLRVPKKTYIRATGWKGPFEDTAAKVKSDPAWSVYEIPCGHDAAIDMPEELAAILERCA